MEKRNLERINPETMGVNQREIACCWVKMSPPRQKVIPKQEGYVRAGGLEKYGAEVKWKFSIK
ncbi:MAG: hypothetical protein KJ600_01585 [Nanoarchaeota archaeon]|nr:hypothetical protein [Nanoarchaeota archaeon]MBU1103231.1 hypothetical protein [Nanoarchaeota archaeon]